jgi:DNA repair protein RadC
MQYRVKIKDMPPEERPRERLLKRGPEALSNAELLAIILRTGTARESVLGLAQRLLKYYNLRQLSQLNTSVLRSIYGISDAKACQIVACFEIARRLASFSEEPNPKITSSRDVYRLLSPRLKDMKKEVFVALYLDTKNRLIREETISIGSLNASIVHPREVFRTAIQESAATLILAHNHPSGEPGPSRDDIDLTREIVMAGKLMGIEVLDHVIIGNSCFISLKEKGLM